MAESCQKPGAPASGLVPLPSEPLAMSKPPHRPLLWVHTDPPGSLRVPTESHRPSGQKPPKQFSQKELATQNKTREGERQKGTQASH